MALALCLPACLPACSPKHHHHHRRRQPTAAAGIYLQFEALSDFESSSLLRLSSREPAGGGQE